MQVRNALVPVGTSGPPRSDGTQLYPNNPNEERRGTWLISNQTG